MTYYTSGEFAKKAHVSIPGGAKRVLAPYFKEVAGGFHITKDAGLFICHK
ncbi:hypothetical protein [Lactobacillus equicursoris]|nr:hypothetical protein [Lactobacillus equicursoris]